ncbi:hypothetical protein HF846_07405 [Clostridium cadaveris]|nr:hypothetical protein [Clostridium cadaveris]
MVMKIIKNLQEEIERAKQETIQMNIQNWKEEWACKHKQNTWRNAPEPPIEEVTPKAWFITNWGTGFIVADLEKVMKLPKRQREKIFALGEIYK